MKLHELKPAPGSRTRRKRIGRGIGSGHGKTATRGHKGLKARSGGAKRPGFEGGQMPLTRRVPKRGFTNIFKQEWAVVNIKDLNRLTDVQDVTPATLIQAGLVHGQKSQIKVLGEGTPARPFFIKAHRFSASAIAKIHSAGGRAEVLGGA